MTTNNQIARGRLPGRMAIAAAPIYFLLGLMMFLPAGIGWRRGWLFLVLFLAGTIASCAYLWRVNPEIFVARSKIHRGTKSWDKVLMVPLLASFVAIFPVAGFDARFGWSQVPAWATIVGYVLFTVGFVLSIWVYSVNKFAEPSVRIQSDRGHRVVATGPYALVRHPLYAFSTLLVVGVALALGSYWALIPVASGLTVLTVRTSWEDRVLQNELAGYREYATRVRYRLIPGVW